MPLAPPEIGLGCSGDVVVWVTGLLGKMKREVVYL